MMKLSERMRELKDEDSAWALTIGLVLIWADEVAQLESENEALRNYVGHTQICPARYDGNDKCMCGFDALLTDLKEVAQSTKEISAIPEDTPAANIQVPP